MPRRSRALTGTAASATDRDRGEAEEGPQRGNFAAATGIIVFLAVFSIAGWASIPLAPVYMDSHPWLVIALAPRLPFLAAAGQMSWFWYLLLGTVRLGVTDPVNYIVGRRWGPSAVDFIRRKTPRFVNRLLDWSEQAVDRFGLLAVAVWSNQRVMILAGHRGLKPRAVAVVNVVGTVAYLAVVRIGWQYVSGPVNSTGQAVAAFFGVLWANMWSHPAPSAGVITAISAGVAYLVVVRRAEDDDPELVLVE